MQKVKNIQGQGLAAGRINEDNRFHIPKAQQVNDVPCAEDLWGDLRPMNVTQHLPAVSALQASGIRQVWIDRTTRVTDGSPADRQVTDDESQDNDSGALVEE